MEIVIYLLSESLTTDKVQDMEICASEVGRDRAPTLSDISKS